MDRTESSTSTSEDEQRKSADQQFKLDDSFDQPPAVDVSDIFGDGVESTEEKVSVLVEEVKELQRKNQELEMDLTDACAERDKQRQRAENLKHKVRNLSGDPKFIATVEDIVSDGIILRQHGNNQEAMTDVSDQLKGDLSVGDRVTINNSLNIIDRIEPETDAAVQAMEIDDAPDVGYDDIGGLGDQIREVKEAIEMPLVNPEQFDTMGIDPPKGVLLRGPPGTGKTMLAKAVAARTDATFIRLAGSELVQKFVGEGARRVRELFEIARKESPAVIFIDELDAIASERTQTEASGEGEVQRTLMQLLSELDGFTPRDDVSIIGATNRFDMLDDAITRPGRFDRILTVPKPDVEGRE